MRPGIGSYELNVVREALFKVNIQSVVVRVPVRQLRVHVGIRIDRPGRAQAAGELRIKDRLGNCSARYRRNKEIVGSELAEIIGSDRADNPQTSRIVYDNQSWDDHRVQSAVGSREREEGCFGQARRRASGRGTRTAASNRIVGREAAEVVHQEIRLHDIYVLRVPQVARVDGNETGRKNRVLAYLTFDRQVALRGIGVFEILANVEREGQDRTKARERARIEPLKAG